MPSPAPPDDAFFDPIAPATRRFRPKIGETQRRVKGKAQVMEDGGGSQKECRAAATMHHALCSWLRRDQCSSLRQVCLIQIQRADTRRSWEERASAHEWEERRASAPDGSSDESDIEDCTQQDAGKALREFLAHLHVRRVLSARQFSTICWWAAKAGAVDSQTEAYQRHGDRCLGLDTSPDDPYVIQAPRYDNFDVSRSVHCGRGGPRGGGRSTRFLLRRRTVRLTGQFSSILDRELGQW